MWLAFTALAVLVALVIMATAGGAGRRDITETVTLTSKEEEWLLGGRAEWDQALEAAWETAVRNGERYETKGGAPRLRLGGLGPDQAQLDALARIVYLAGEAERELVEEAGGSLSREERLERRVERLEGKLYDAGSKYDAKHHWWNRLDAEERKELRRAGQSWRDFMN